MLRSRAWRVAGLVFAVILFTGSCGSANESRLVRSEITLDQQRTEKHDFAQEFLRALLSKDLNKLRKFVSNESSYFGPDGFLQGLDHFLYVSTQKKRSITEIASDGPIEIVLVPQAGGVEILIFVPSVYRPLLETKDFLETAWMDKYFACQFQWKEGKWLLYQNFCFDETGGPFQFEVG